MLPDQATKGYSLWCLGKILRRPYLLLRESVSGPRTIKTKLWTMTTFLAFRILHPTIWNIIRPQPGKLLDARAFEWMDAVVWGMGGVFLRVISGANLLINIIEGPRKISGDFAMGFSGCFRTRLPKGTPFGAWAKF